MTARTRLTTSGHGRRSPQGSEDSAAGRRLRRPLDVQRADFGRHVNQVDTGACKKASPTARCDLRTPAVGRLEDPAPVPRGGPVGLK
jgi:hypothetical protein